MQKDKKLDSLTDSQITYSYNLYVVLDQLARIYSSAKCGETPVRLTPEEHKGLKSLVDENDEDLLIYFEEYVEKSGPVYIESGQAFKAFLRFGKNAKNVFARSKKFKASGKQEKDSGPDTEEDDDEDQLDTIDEDSAGAEEEGGSHTTSFSIMYLVSRCYSSSGYASMGNPLLSFIPHVVCEDLSVFQMLLSC